MNTFKHTFRLRFLLKVQQTLIPYNKLFRKKWSGHVDTDNLLILSDKPYYNFIEIKPST